MSLKYPNVLQNTTTSIIYSIFVGLPIFSIHLLPMNVSVASIWAIVVLSIPSEFSFP